MTYTFRVLLRLLVPPALLASSLAVSLAVTPSAVATPSAAEPRSSDAGLLVFEIDEPEQDPSWWSVGSDRSPFGGTEHGRLTAAIDAAYELDLSAFATEGRIQQKGADVCLGVSTATPTRPARAQAEPCDDDDPDQEWRVDAGAGDLLRNVGTGLWVQDTRSVLGWSLTDAPTAPAFRVLTEYLDGRPDLPPSIDADHDVATDSITLTGRGQTPGADVEVATTEGPATFLTTVGDTGAFRSRLSPAFGDRERIRVRVGGGAWSSLTLRVPAIDEARVVLDDGAPVLVGDGGPGMRVRVGSGPLESDVIATGIVDDAGSIRIPLPDAEPGDRVVVWLERNGVRTELVVPQPLTAVEAVDGPETVLDRSRPTPVPIGLRVLEPTTRITSTVSLNAPAGTVFTPGITSVTGERKPSGGAWSGSDDRFALSQVRVSDDGRTLTGTVELGVQDRLTAGDELRWWPTLDVVDPDVAPAST